MSAHKKSFLKTSDFILYSLIIISLILEFLIPTSFSIENLCILGIILFVVGSALIVMTKNQFKRLNQKTGPGYEITELIKNGLFRYSRNPIYFGLLIVLISLSFLLNNLWILLSVVPFVFLINHILIIPEERYLLDKFGDEYKNYRKKVRRWV